MKRLFFVILLAIATVNSYAQYKDKGYFMADTVKLNATYRELLKHPESCLLYTSDAADEL